jgi:hypothetical protein
LELKLILKHWTGRVGIATDRDKILKRIALQTNIPGYYALVMLHRTSISSRSSAEGINCVEKIAGMHVEPIDYETMYQVVLMPLLKLLLLV